MHSEPAALFLFAHQDDEYGVFHRIEQCVRRGLRVHCAYLTDGATAVATAQRRNRESLAVLQRLGVRAADVVFAGEQQGIPDAGLAAHMPKALAWIRGWFAQFAQVDSIHVMAWEGAHHDHDALHALVVIAANEAGLLERVRQFPLYHAYRSYHPFFNAVSPLAANGPVQSERIPFRSRLRYLGMCLSYPSQFRITWAGLFPFMLLRYLAHGCQDLQPVSLARIGQQPYPGTLYYERRGFYTWDAMRSHIAKCIRPHTDTDK